MRLRRVGLAMLGGVVIVTLGCQPSQIAAAPTATTTTVSATATTVPTPTSAVPATTPTRPSTRAAVVSTPSPAATSAGGPLHITVDGQPITADSLPSPQAYYAQMLAAHGKDLSSCRVPPTPRPGACPKPSSLGSIDLKQQINIELILDDSVSMAEEIGGETKLDIAKRVLSDFITTLPHNANVALRVLGHKGSNADADKAVSCAASELLYPFQPLDTARFQQAIESFQPTGWTPLAMSFDRAQADFAQFDPATSSNFVYVVTDGLETCDGDPVASAQALHATGVQPIVNLVGFDVDAQATEQLRQAAQAGGGKFYSARNADELNNVFKSNFDWAAWTAYYNCRYGAATNQFNTVTGRQTASFNCYTGGMTDEYNELTGDLTNRFNKITGAATNAFNQYSGAHTLDGTDLTPASDEYYAVIQRATEDYNYAYQQEQMRYDRAINTSTTEYEQVINDATAQYDQAVHAVEAEQTQTPTP